MPEKNIHWFPGHMKKALNEIEARLKIIDIVIEILDARAPLSSDNHLLDNVIKNKAKLYILSKSDYVSEKDLEAWIKHYKDLGISVLSLNLLDKKSPSIIKKEIMNLGSFKREKEMRKGLKPQPIRVMVVGIPNVGKSTLINKLAKRNAASVENKPGHTKSQQWIKVDNDINLLDTPGVLPNYFATETNAINVALIGSIKETILPNYSLADYLLDYLKSNYLSQLNEHFDIKASENSSNKEILEDIAERRGFLGDLEKAENLLLVEFRNGNIGKIILEKI